MLFRSGTYEIKPLQTIVFDKGQCVYPEYSLEDIRPVSYTHLDVYKRQLMNIESLEDLINHYPYRYDVIEETYPTQEDDKIIIEGTLKMCIRDRVE